MKQKLLHIHARHLSRRSFIRQVGTALSLGTAVTTTDWATGLWAAEAKPAQKSLVGSNIYGWGQYYQRENKKMNVEEVMTALHDLGYDYLEGNLDVGQPEQNAKFAEQMRARGLKPVTLYTGARLHEADKAKAVVQKILAAAKVCQTAGFQALSCNPDPIGREKTDAELQNQAAALNDLGAGLKELGIRLGIHNHTPEMANRAREFYYNFQHTDPQFVGFCYDVHWVYRGGLMPRYVLRDYGQRIVSWHLRQSRNGIWWEDLDTGDIDYTAIALYAKEHQLARLFTVELALENGTKVTRSAIENHRRSREFVRRVFEA